MRRPSIRWWSGDRQAERRFAVLAMWFSTCGGLAVAGSVAMTAVAFGYVSEAGVPGAPASTMYRLGVTAVAVGVGLLAAALRRVTRLAAIALAGAAPLALTSGAVPCTPGCPLPPHETPGAIDLVHAVASTGGLLLVAVAMTFVAFEAPPHTRLRWISRVGVGLTVPLLGAAGLAILVVGRGYIAGLLERAALGGVLGWLAVTAHVQSRE